MEVFDFIDEDDLGDLPEDSQQAFVHLVKRGKAKFDARIRELNQEGNTEYEPVEDARYGFQNFVMGLAKQFKIEPLASLPTPPLDKYGAQDYRQFRADLTQYMTQIVVGASERDRNDSVPLPEKSTENLRSRIAALREAIDRDPNITEATKARLHKRLDDFESELKRRRIRIWAIARILFEILALPGVINESRVAVQEFASFVMREIGEAKSADHENRQVPYHEPIALIPVRPAERKRPEIDDEIPF